MRRRFSETFENPVFLFTPNSIYISLSCLGSLISPPPCCLCRNSQVVGLLVASLLPSTLKRNHRPQRSYAPIAGTQNAHLPPLTTTRVCTAHSFCSPLKPLELAFLSRHLCLPQTCSGSIACLFGYTSSFQLDCKVPEGRHHRRSYLCYTPFKVSNYL